MSTGTPVDPQHAVSSGLRWRAPSVLRAHAARAGGALPAAAFAALAALCVSAQPNAVAVRFPAASVSVVEHPLSATGGVVRVELPRTAAFVDQATVLRVRLASTASERRAISVSIGALPRGPLLIDGAGAARADLTLPAGFGGVLTGSQPVYVTLRGSGAGWSLTSLDLANFHLKTGGAFPVLIVPAAAAFDAPPRGPLLAALGVLLLASLPVGRTRARRPASVAVATLSAAGAVALAACVLLPAVSSYRVLLTPSGFWMVALVAFAPSVVRLMRLAVQGIVAAAGLIVALARLLMRPLAALAGSVRTVWLRHPEVAERTAVVFGLAALAVAHPILEVVSNSPEFFVARSTTVGVALGTVAVLCFGLPLTLAAAGLLIRRIAPRVSRALHLMVVGVLAALLAAPWLERAGAAGPTAVVALSAALGFGAAAAYARLEAVRLFLAALAPAALVVPAWFLLGVDVRDALVPGHAMAPAGSVERTPPIVFVVFDEFPTNTLLDADGSIDEGRFPHFAALARGSYWFRQASAVNSETMWSVPAIVSGIYPLTPRAVPTLRYYPGNLFTLLRRDYDIFVFGRFLQLCPPADCHYDSAVPGDSVPALLGDLAIVYLHAVVPEPWRADLPPIVGDWRGFVNLRIRGGPRRDAALRDPLAEFDRFVATLEEGPGRLYFLHTLFPHMPFRYVPSGRQYASPSHQAIREQRRPLFEKAGAEYAEALHQRHILQVGFVDRLVGRLLNRLRALGIYDEAVIVITADHGCSFHEGQPRRQVRAGNVADILLVPLFVKLPGQKQGETIDRNVENIDILPTLASVLSLKPAPQMDGRSLLEVDRADPEEKTYVTRSHALARLQTTKAWRATAETSLARKIARFGAGTERLLYSTPETRSLPGTPVERYDVRAAGRVAAAIARPQRFDAVDTSDQRLPLYVWGTLEGAGTDPLTLAIALNGEIAATTRSYRANGIATFGTVVPEDALREGANELGVYVVDRKDGAIVLSLAAVHYESRAQPAAAAPRTSSR